MNYPQVTPSTPVHFFIHIPKCGGTTFSDYLSRHFPLERIYTASKSTEAWENFVESGQQPRHKPPIRMPWFRWTKD